MSAKPNSLRRAVTADAARNFKTYAVAGGTAVMFTQAAPYKKTAPNEDCAAIIPCGDSRGVLAVADGVGGMPAGHEASAAVIAALVNELKDARKSLHTALAAAIKNANRALLAGGRGNACTIGAAVVEDGAVRACHIGDTEVLLVGPRGGKKLRTTAHSPTAAALAAGRLSEEQAITHPHRNIVDKIVGTDEDVTVDVSNAIALAPGDTLAVASDGLWDNFYEREISAMICNSPLPDAAATLAAAAHRRMTGDDADSDLPGHGDDLTFILYRPNP